MPGRRIRADNSGLTTTRFDKAPVRTFWGKRAHAACLCVCFHVFALNFTFRHLHAPADIECWMYNRTWRGVWPPDGRRAQMQLRGV